MSNERAIELLNEAEQFLSKCHDNLNEDKEVDLQGFEDKIKEFCDIITALPPEEAKQYEEVLKAMGESLTVLSGELTRKRDMVKNKIGGLDSQQKANKAYGKGASYDKPEKE